MSYSSTLGSPLTNTKLRTKENVSKVSGMCSVCSADCIGTCEIGLSALRGADALFLHKADINQFASEKDYPLDFSHFNINGKVFGAEGCAEDAETATFTRVNLDKAFGKKDPIISKLPIILPAIAKLNWQDYYAGAAMAGIMVVIGEDVVAKDKGLELVNGKVGKSPLIAEMAGVFRKYYRGYGDIILQGNYDDFQLGVLEYAIENLGIKSVEIKFGQASKGIQGIGKVGSAADAERFKNMGYLINPSPDEARELSYDASFERIGKLPMWNEESLQAYIEKLRKAGAQKVCFKVGPFDPESLIRIIKIAIDAKIDLITFDGAGGGSGSSPIKMMNEWGVPTVYLESLLHQILSFFKQKNMDLPQIALGGGFAMEDQVFKGLALGAPFVDFIAVARGAMAAAQVGKTVGELLKNDNLPERYKAYGNTKELLFVKTEELMELYKGKNLEISTGAIGVYSYIQRLAVGLQQLLALNRKFNVNLVSREDIYPLTEIAKEVSGLKSYSERTQEILDKLM